MRHLILSAILRHILLSIALVLTFLPQCAYANPQTAPEVPLDLNLFAAAIRPGFERDLLSMLDVPRYLIDMKIDPDTRVVSGVERVRYTNRERMPLQKIVLRLYPNTSYLGGSMRLNGVTLDDHPVQLEPYRPDVMKDESAWSLTLGTPLVPRQSVELGMRYVVTAPLEPKNGYTTFGQIEGILALPDAYVMIAPRMGDAWLADPAAGFGDIVQSEMAMYHVTVHVPSGVTAAPSGVCQSGSADPAARVTANRPSEQLLTCVSAPARDFAVHLSRDYKVLTSTLHDDRPDPVIVHSYFTVARQHAGELALTHAMQALKVFERRFGAYPYREFSIFESKSIAGGIEYPLSVGENYAMYQQDGGYSEWITAHEVSHQWWYGMVGSDQLREAWLDEALAQYSASLYIEDQYGKATAEADRQRFFVDRYAAALKERGDSVVAQPTIAFYRWSYAPVIYAKAPQFYTDVRAAIGDARFDLWLRTYFEHFRLSFAHAQDLLSVADSLGFGAAVREAYARRIAGH